MEGKELVAAAVSAVAVASVAAAVALMAPDAVATLVHGLGDAWSVSVNAIPIGSNSIG